MLFLLLRACCFPFFPRIPTRVLPFLLATSPHIRKRSGNFHFKPDVSEDLLNLHLRGQPKAVPSINGLLPTLRNFSLIKSTYFDAFRKLLPPLTICTPDFRLPFPTGKDSFFFLPGSKPSFSSDERFSRFRSRERKVYFP